MRDVPICNKSESIQLVLMSIASLRTNIARYKRLGSVIPTRFDIEWSGIQANSNVSEEKF